MDPTTQVNDNVQDNTEDNAQEAAAPTANTSSASTRKVSYEGRPFNQALGIIQRQVHPTCRMSEDATGKLNSIVMSLFDRIASEAKELAIKQRRSTLLPRDIEFACKLLLPEEFQAEARSAGEIAVENYEEYQKQKAARRN